MTFDEYRENTALFRSTIANLQKQLEKPYEQMFEQIREYQQQILRPVNDVINEAVQSITQEFQNAFISSSGYKEMQERLAELHRQIIEQLSMQLSDYSNIERSVLNIQVTDDGIVLPDELIPENIPDNENPQDISSQPSKDITSVSGKKISISDTLNIIGILISVILGIITIIQTSKSSLEDQVNREETIAIYQEQLNAANLANEYLCAIYTLLSEHPEYFQASGSAHACIEDGVQNEALSTPADSDALDNSDMQKQLD